MYSVIVNGRVLDYKYSNYNDKIPGMYCFQVGDRPLGFISKVGSRWSAVPTLVPLGFTVRGFSTRLDAAEFLVDISIGTLKDTSNANLSSHVD